MNGFDRKTLPARDRSILFSMASQLKKPLALTEKQANLAMKIINENKHLYESIEELNSLLENPLYKYTFRNIDSSRKIFLITEDKIAIKFPFDNVINKLLDKLPGRKNYDIVSRAHVYKLNEINIESIMNIFKDRGFEIDLKIEQWYKEIEDIKSSPTSHVPSININENVEISNCNSYTEEYFNKNKSGVLIEDLFLAKTMNLFFSKEIHDIIQTLNISELTKKYLVNSSYSVSVAGILKQDLCMTFQELNSYPILILADENEKELMAWIISLRQYGVDPCDMSVLFRSDKNVAFNEYIKTQQLNNLVDTNTKVVFIKNKMPKILYKLNFTPKIIVSSSMFYVHYTSQKVVDSHPAVMYYSEKQHIGKKIAQL
jgi:hypothetical protein